MIAIMTNLGEFMSRVHFYKKLYFKTLKVLNAEFQSIKIFWVKIGASDCVLVICYS